MQIAAPVTLLSDAPKQVVAICDHLVAFGATNIRIRLPKSDNLANYRVLR
jgi:hypothetical protein